ncbi:hypothetical protein BRC86_08705 [Halobacteriales archaeon QS_3_64_16]|nr:MAG: hypothetical protein BRC86_08705 [Halobacteriales archaeon QS_3_64_16]
MIDRWTLGRSDRSEAAGRSATPDGARATGEADGLLPVARCLEAAAQATIGSPEGPVRNRRIRYD